MNEETRSASEDSAFDNEKLDKDSVENHDEWIKGDYTEYISEKKVLTMIFWSQK